MNSGGRLAPPTDADWREVVALLRGADDICLVAHIHPDGDTLGSALAVGLALRELGKRPYVTFGENPLVVPKSLSFLPGLDLLVPPDQVPPAPELVVVFDAASIERLGVLVDNARAARAMVVIDHHASNTRFGTHHVVDVAAPATAVLAEELVRRLGAKLTVDVASALYTGLVTDTGSFRYSGTSPATHELAGRLLATGVRHDFISREIWDSAAFGYLKVLARALERARLRPEAAGGQGLVWTVVSLADRDEFGVEMDEIEGVIDVIRKTTEADVAVVLKEDADGGFRVSVRSKGGVDVGLTCSALGGGGHRFAAGFTSSLDVETTIERFLGQLVEDAPEPV